jgi:hypothetical protein
LGLENAKFPNDPILRTDLVGPTLEPELNASGLDPTVFEVIDLLPVPHTFLGSLEAMPSFLVSVLRPDIEIRRMILFAP